MLFFFLLFFLVYCPVFVSTQISLIPDQVPSPTDARHPQKFMLPSLCFKMGMDFSESWAFLGFHQVLQKKVKFHTVFFVCFLFSIMVFFSLLIHQSKLCWIPGQNHGCAILFTFLVMDFSSAQRDVQCLVYQPHGQFTIQLWIMTPLYETSVLLHMYTTLYILYIGPSIWYVAISLYFPPQMITKSMCRCNLMFEISVCIYACSCDGV